MSATDWLELVERLIVPAFVADLLVFTFATWWISRWRAARRQR